VLTCGTSITLPVGGPYLFIQRYRVPGATTFQSVNYPGRYTAPGPNMFRPLIAF
jgi:hypothetical protein